MRVQKLALSSLVVVPLSFTAAMSPAAAAPAAAVSVSVPAAVPTAAVPVPTAVSTREVRDLQKRLNWAGMGPVRITGTIDAPTKGAVKHFQEKYLLRRTGTLDAATRAKLRAVTANGAGIDERCKRPGKVICVNKKLRLMRAMKDGKVLWSNDARFGGSRTPTRSGSFTVQRKSRHHVSSLYGSKMPFALFFSGGQAVHYSADFDAKGYRGASHGCVNLRNRAGAERLFDWAPVGTRVVVYAG